jgi:uncharacterized protein (TIGR02596 family)
LRDLRATALNSQRVARRRKQEVRQITPLATVSRVRAFTLLELMLTMGIVALLSFISITGLSRLIEANAIGSGAQMIQDCLAEAQQDAIAQNTTVEVRLYAAASGDAFNTLQLHLRNADGTTPSIAPPVLLPASTVIDDTPVHSSLVTTNAQTPSPDPADPRLNAQTRCFHFLPGGATDLATPGPWTLTVRAASQSNPARFPSNWACVTLDPVTGRAQIYRP